MQITLPVTVAWTLWQRIRGLLAHPAPPDGYGFLIPCCHAIHTVGMSYSIDVLFLDHNYRVLSVRHGLAPSRYARQSHATIVVELAAGEAAKKMIKLGDIMNLIIISSPNPADKTASRKKGVHEPCVFDSCLTHSDFTHLRESS